MATIFSKIISGEIPAHVVWQDADAVAFMDVKPINPGHVLLVPRLEEDYVFDLPEPLYLKLWTVARRLQAAIKNATGCKRVGIAVEGFAVPHAHIHLVPLYAGNELDPNRAKPAGGDDLRNMRDKIVQALGLM